VVFKLKLLLVKIKTAFRLGLKNIFIVSLYKFSIRYSIHPACKLDAKSFSGPFFKESLLLPSGLKTLSSWNKSATLFSHIEIPLNSQIPKWTSNPLSGKHFNFPLQPWWKISDFNENIGDIKLVWELSRMNWVIAFAQRARNGDRNFLIKLNEWLEDWLKNNPPYLGPNWKCGQEASIRIINLCCAALITNEIENSTRGLRELIRLHLKRILSTVSYSTAQENNHGTSEAAALFIGGTWLAKLGFSDGKKYEKIGRKLLQNRASKLIQKDGSFSQYSINYHRMVLDTFSIVEVWRKRIDVEALSDEFYESASKATSWLYQMVCDKNGHVPNIGANDGSLLLQLTDCSYRDFRPSVQLAASQFLGRKVYLNVPDCDLHLSWLGIDNNQYKSYKYINCNFDYGGYKILRSSDAKVYFRYPRFKYRPSQADAFHIDFWVNRSNIFGDAGSYSYNSIPDMSSYFSGTSSHNTIQFDDRDQMPKLGRFLFGSWLKVNSVSPVLAEDGNVSCSANYCDYKGTSHIRDIRLNSHSLSVVDKVKGFRKKAIIRWRLPNNEWTKRDINNGIEISNNMGFIIEVSSNKSIVRASIVQGWKSLFYLKKVQIPVLELEISGPATITTDVRWAK
jgi:hypothetical protein